MRPFFVNANRLMQICARREPTDSDGGRLGALDDFCPTRLGRASLFLASDTTFMQETR